MNRKSSRSAAAARPKLLHLHSSFDRGGAELRCVQLMNAFGDRAEHTIVSAQPAALSAAGLIAPEVPALFPLDFPALTGKPWPGRLKKLAEAMRGFDLVLTYDWGAIDAVLAHTLFAQAFDLPPLVHHEDGFGEDEVRHLKGMRKWYRQIALGRAAALVVPSRRLERIALEIWHQPRARVHRIPRGVATRAFSKKPDPGALPDLVKRKNEKWVGTLARLRKVKNLPALVRAITSLPEEWHLVILGEGPEREAILHEAEAQRIEHRVHLPGFFQHPSEVVGLFDIFALSSTSEQFPVAVVEAMAAGLPVLAPNVGDIAEMVAPENQAFIVTAHDDAALINGLSRLALEPALRTAIGRANRTRAGGLYDEARMIERYRALYGALLGGNRL